MEWCLLLFAFLVGLNLVISRECKDLLNAYRCTLMQNHDACTKRRFLVRIFCRKHCGVCGDVKCRSTRYGCCHDGKTPAKGPYFQGCKEPCRDERSSYFCQSIVRAGFCGKPRFKQFSNLCLNSCRMCRPCEDSASTECRFFARRGRCDTDKSKTYNRCRKSCHVCGVKDPCQGFICAKPNTRCRVDHLGVPYCGCRVHCDPDDHYTGTVCGRDGKEYKNKCRLLHSNCEIPNIAKIQNYGKCPSLNIKEPCIDKRSSYFCQSIARAEFCNKRHLQKTIDMCKHSCKKC